MNVRTIAPMSDAGRRDFLSVDWPQFPPLSAMSQLEAVDLFVDASSVNYTAFSKKIR
jgi:hypothetical protein